MDTNPLFQYLLRLADSSLTMGQRLAEWCGHGPYLEEDVALTNISLDFFGHANLIYQLAVEVEGKDKSVDDLAFLRDAELFRNPLLTELPRGDFAYTMLKQYFVDVFNLALYKNLSTSSYQPLAEVAQKIVIEVKYHQQRSTEWIKRLSLGGDEARNRMQVALDQLWFYTPELFEKNAEIQSLIDQNITVDPKSLKDNWDTEVEKMLEVCHLKPPTDGWIATGGLIGEHSEHLGHMLAEMQFLQRAYPGCEW